MLQSTQRNHGGYQPPHQMRRIPVSVANCIVRKPPNRNLAVLVARKQSLRFVHIHTLHGLDIVSDDAAVLSVTAPPAAAP